MKTILRVRLAYLADSRSDVERCYIEQASQGQESALYPTGIRHYLKFHLLSVLLQVVNQFTQFKSELSERSGRRRYSNGASEDPRVSHTCASTPSHSGHSTSKISKCSGWGARSNHVQTIHMNSIVNSIEFIWPAQTLWSRQSCDEIVHTDWTSSSSKSMASGQIRSLAPQVSDCIHCDQMWSDTWPSWCIDVPCHDLIPCLGADASQIKAEC